MSSYFIPDSSKSIIILWKPVTFKDHLRMDLPNANWILILQISTRSVAGCPGAPCDGPKYLRDCLKNSSGLLPIHSSVFYSLTYNFPSSVCKNRFSEHCVPLGQAQCLQQLIFRALFFSLLPRCNLAE